jgi:predicted ester cyclase
MSKESDNKAIVGRWFTSFWGEKCDLSIVDEIAAPNMLLHYSLHEPRRGREDIKAFMTGFRAAFPDLNFWGAADLIAEGDYVVGRWEGGGTHTGAALDDFLVGSLPAATGKKMKFTGTTVLRLENGMIVEEIGLDDGVKLFRAGTVEPKITQAWITKPTKATTRQAGAPHLSPMKPPSEAPIGRAPVLTARKIAETRPNMTEGVTVCRKVVDVIVQTIGPTPNRKKEAPATQALGSRIVATIVSAASTEIVGPTKTARPKDILAMMTRSAGEHRPCEWPCRLPVQCGKPPRVPEVTKLNHHQSCVFAPRKRASVEDRRAYQQYVGD